MSTTPTRTPYTAKGVRYVDQGPIITAVWVSDPAVDPAEALDKILHRDLPYEVEIIAEATRYYKREGASFSGWIISQPGSGNYSTEPITRKRQAAAALREWVAGVFEDRQARKAAESPKPAQEPQKAPGTLVDPHTWLRMPTTGRQAATAPRTYTYTAETYGDAPGEYVTREFIIAGPLYHGGGRRLREGAQLTTGRRTNGWGDEGTHSRYVHFTTRLDVAAAYAEQTGGHVYEVEPTGDFSIGYSGDEYKTEHPMNVLRRLKPEEWQR